MPETIVQEAQKQAGENQPSGGANAQPQQPQFNLDTASKEQFLDRIKVDDDLRKEYMNDSGSEKFRRINDLIEGRLDTNAGAQQQPSNHQQPQQQQAPAQQVGEGQGADSVAQQPQEELIDLTGVKIPKGLFGTYLSGGRSAADAVVEALKGNLEKDKTITSFRGRNDQLINDTLNLRRELMTALKDKGTAQQDADTARSSAAQQLAFGNMQEIEQIDFNALEDFDPYDPATHPKVDKAREGLNKLKKVFDGLKGKQQQAPQAQAVSQDQQQPVAQPPATKADPELEKTRSALQKSVVDMEFADIEALQAAVPELRTSIPFSALDQAVANFQSSVASAAGMPNNIGSALELYFSNTPQGENFRALCDARGTKPPEGYEVHQFIVGKVRPLRLKNIENYRTVVEAKAGKKLEPWEVLDAPGISYKDLYRNVEPYKPPTSAAPTPQVPQPSPKLQQVIEQHKQQPAMNTVPEIPPSMGSPQVGDDASGMQASDAMELIDRFHKNPKSLNQDEIAKLRKVYAYAKQFGGPDPSAIDQRLQE